MGNLPNPLISRRKFLSCSIVAGMAGTYYSLIPYQVFGMGRPKPKRPGEELGFFDYGERLALANFCDLCLPGASDLGAVCFIETLLTAFESNPPRIYAGGPFSGRNPDPRSNQVMSNQFEKFIPLNRFQEAAWRLYLYGPDAIPGGPPNLKLIEREQGSGVLGVDIGLRKLLYQGVFQAYRMMPESGLVVKPTSTLQIWNQMDGLFREMVQNLTIQSVLSNPEYGGNHQLEGWKWAHFQGDTAPYGYSHFEESTGSYSEDPNRPVTNPEPTNPDPMGFTANTFFWFASLGEDGRQFY